MTKRKWLFATAISLVLLTGCSDNGVNEPEASSADDDDNLTNAIVDGNANHENGTSAEDDAEHADPGSEPLSDQEFKQMITNPDQFKGALVEYTGRVFVVESDAQGIYLQVWSDIDYSDDNTLVSIPETDIDISEDDYVQISGIVREAFTGENAFGATLTLPVIDALDYEIVDYVTAVSPTLHEVTVDETLDQHGYRITVDKVEFGERDTRVYLTVENDSDSSVNFWRHSAQIIANGRQYDYESPWEADYPDVQSDIRSGVTSEGILSFPVIDLDETDAIELFLDGSSDDWDVTIEEFHFDIEL